MSEPILKLAVAICPCRLYTASKMEIQQENLPAVSGEMQKGEYTWYFPAEHI